MPESPMVDYSVPVKGLSSNIYRLLMLNFAVVVLLIRPRPVLVGAVDHNTQGFPYFHPPGVRFAITRYIGRVF
jgi:hypothetical protein